MVQESGSGDRDMEAVILAAGLGTRLRPHTEKAPKPLLAVQGRPILDWTLGALPRAVDRVIVVTHYLAEQIDAYLRGQAHFKDWVTVPRASALTNTSSTQQSSASHHTP